jgi:predicted amidohydrolase YtcJ
MKAGIMMPSGSDYPITSPDPWLGIYAMLTRKDQATGRVYGPEQTIGILDALLKALGPKYMNTFIGVKTWKDNGVIVALNADHMEGFDPVRALNPYHPMLAMQAAITRKTQGGQVIGPAERISRLDALRMTTINAAYIGFEEQKKGSIEVGKLADLAVLDLPDILELDRNPDLALKMNERVLMTLVGGKILYEKGR